MAYAADIFGAAVVAVGSFNPAIFSPKWLERNKLIGSDDTKDAIEDDFADKLLVSRQVSTFETKWFSLQVLENQFSLTSKDALSPAFRDLAIGIFELVPHTPVSAVGLNFMAHFKMPTLDTYYKIGDILAPKDIWKDLFPEEWTPGLGEMTIKIQNGVRGEVPKSADEKRITIQPSVRVKAGVYMLYNDHRVMPKNEDEKMPGEWVSEILDKDWQRAWEDSTRVFDTVLTRTVG